MPRSTVFWIVRGDGFAEDFRPSCHQLRRRSCLRLAMLHARQAQLPLM
jgi:hypothetical protein